ncbi:hypothetical protein PISMIDRAFT_9627 [Pisolithus microcarpus 441]|uniref:Uncharacterized protein n=1 Tax=Pisolithus microcarpus 441 TaxID=765257 RepID=A0A0C9ZHH7_9AGAM|nr:hypothetical protein PISMIDRAFT_9627 [Pisolithus microcarpus 441]
MATLLNQLMFLRNSVSKNSKTCNFAHPAIKDVILNIFYTGSYCIAHQQPVIF